MEYSFLIWDLEKTGGNTETAENREVDERAMRKLLKIKGGFGIGTEEKGSDLPQRARRPEHKEHRDGLGEKITRRRRER